MGLCAGAYAGPMITKKNVNMTDDFLGEYRKPVKPWPVIVGYSKHGEPIWSTDTKGEE